MGKHLIGTRNPSQELSMERQRKRHNLIQEEEDKIYRNLRNKRMATKKEHKGRRLSDYYTKQLFGEMFAKW